MGFPIVSVRSRGKRIGNYCTNSGIYTVDYEIKGDRRKMLGKTIRVENVPYCRFRNSWRGRNHVKTKSQIPVNLRTRFSL